jgi:hypothetical protein
MAFFSMALFFKLTILQPPQFGKLFLMTALAINFVIVLGPKRA